MITKFTTAAIVVISASITLAQDEGFMYGKVTTVDDRQYEGPIRWGNDEVLWIDMFNAAKPHNDNLRYLSRDEIRDLRDRRYEQNHSWGERWVSRWVNYDYDDDEFTHQFVCQFGEIKSIRPTWRKSADLEMQNGQKFEVSGEGYSDVGGEVQVLDTELGVVSIQWGRIELVEFMQGPSKLKEKFGEVLYGTVESSRGNFTGLVAWDNDERLSIDKLDGRATDGKVSIEFDKIARIERSWDESKVELRSGRTLQMCCSNDVDNGNRGIVVEDAKLGKVLIPWREFKHVKFEKPGKMKGYNEFKNRQSELIGAVTYKNGKTVEGRIIYDLDEAFTYEVLQGKDNDLEFFVPFREISVIRPDGWRGASLELRNGVKLRLEEGQDVSEKHTGVLVFAGNASPTYILWEDIEVLRFK